MLLAIILGLALGAGLTWPLSRWVVGRVAGRFAPSPQGRRFVAVCALVFGAIALAPAVFLAVMSAGSVAASLARRVAAAVGLEAAWSLVLMLEIAGMTLLTLIVHVVFGAGLGALAARSLGSVERGSGAPRGAG